MELGRDLGPIEICFGSSPPLVSSYPLPLITDLLKTTAHNHLVRITDTGRILNQLYFSLTQTLSPPLSHKKTFVPFHL